MRLHALLNWHTDVLHPHELFMALQPHLENELRILIWIVNFLLAVTRASTRKHTQTLTHCAASRVTLTQLYCSILRRL